MIRRSTLFLFFFLTLFFTFAAHSQNSSQCRLYNSRGKEFFDKGMYSQAEKLYKKAVTADFLNPLTRFNLAILYKKQKKYKKSLDNIKKAISLKPFETEYTHFLLELYILLYKESLKIGQPEQAESFLAKALKQDENFFGAHFILLEKELKEKKYAEAESRIDALIEKNISRKIKLRDTELASVLVRKALIAFYKKDFYETYRYIARVRKDCKEITKKDQKIIKKITGPANELAHALIEGDKAWEKKDYERAYNFYKKAIGIRPDLKTISDRLTKLANIRIAQEKYRDALELFKEDKFTEALRECDNMISLYPESDEIQGLIEKCNARLKAIEKNVKKQKEKEKKEQIRTQKIKYMLEQAESLFSAGQLETAEEEIRKILQIDPSNSYALEFGSRINDKRDEIIKEKEIFKSLTTAFNENNFELVNSIIKDNPNLENNFRRVLFFKAVLYNKKKSFENALSCVDGYLKFEKKDIRANVLKLQLLAKTSSPQKVLETIKSLSNDVRDDLEIIDIRSGIEKEIQQKKNARLITKALYAVAGIFILLILKFFFTGLPRWSKNRKFKKLQKLSSTKKWSAAANLCSQILAGYTHDRVSRNKLKAELARCCMEMGNTSEAIRLSREVLRDEKKNIKVTRTLAHAFLKSGNKSDEAIREYLKLYEFESTNQALVKILAECFIEQGSLDEKSREIIDKYIKINSEDIKFISAYAELLAEAMAGDKQAIAVYEKKLDSDPAAVEVRDALMTSFYKRKAYEKAAEQAMILLNYDSKNINFHRIYSDSMISLGRAAEALEFYRTSGLESQEDIAYIIDRIKTEME